MILKARESTIAYRCPKCGKGVVSVVGVFALSGELLKLKCPCGESELTISYTSDDKIRLCVPCIVCPKPHNYVVSREVFFNRDIFALECGYTGLDICFIGREQQITEALQNSEKQLMELFDESQLEALSRGRHDSRGYFDDARIEDVVRFVLSDLAAEGEIICECEDGGEYAFEFEEPDYESVRVFCKKCGCHVSIPMTGTISANAFLHCDRLELRK